MVLNIVFLPNPYTHICGWKSHRGYPFSGEYYRLVE